MAEKPHIAVVPSPGVGHLIPLAEFAGRLVHRHGFAVTFFIPSHAPPSSAVTSILAALPPAVRHVFLPTVSLSDLPAADLRIETIISLTVARSLPALRAALRPPLAALVVDLFATDAFDVAAALGVPRYVFFPASAFALSLFFHLPRLDAAVAGPYRDVPHPVPIPGCIPIPGSDLLHPVQDRQNDAYRQVLRHARRYRMADGVLLNSFPEIEPGPIKAFQDEKPPVYPVGPLVRTGDPNGGAPAGSEECLGWLDEQPAGSVLFVSFGSGGTLSRRQMVELAVGLETSEQRFLWVVRPPDDGASNGCYFNPGGEEGEREGPLGFLPAGFVERVRLRGAVVPEWAPQTEVLSHRATGGFLSHCGWNSTLESVAAGVPLVAWPLFAEQRMNAAMLVGEVGVALRPAAGEDGVVGREEVARVVRELMEGEGGKRVRNRMRELSALAAKAVGPEGSSEQSLAGVVRKWKAPAPATTQST